MSSNACMPDVSDGGMSPLSSWDKTLEKDTKQIYWEVKNQKQWADLYKAIKNHEEVMQEVFWTDCQDILQSSHALQRPSDHCRWTGGMEGTKSWQWQWWATVLLSRERRERQAQPGFQRLQLSEQFCLQVDNSEQITQDSRNSRVGAFSSSS